MRNPQQVTVVLALLAGPAWSQAEHAMAVPMDSKAMTKDPMEMSSMAGLLGSYQMSRESSGTSWQPESTPSGGWMKMSGERMIMVHGYADLLYDNQGGPRGDSKLFSANMLMVMLRQPVGAGVLGLRGMVSLEPATIGKRGYPLLLQTGETADGKTPLIDRQHPHDLFMELAGTYSRSLGNGRSVFIYAGLPGEPALGPPTFMHRFSGQEIPEAPLGHHWLDSKHITFGVATVGFVQGAWKLEASSFTGREPDEKRWNIESPKFDSWSARMSWNPTPDWALQVSHGRLHSPEQLEPDVDIDRSTISASLNSHLGDDLLQTTVAWGRNHKRPGSSDASALLESTLRVADRHSFFGRLERGERSEPFEGSDPFAGRRFTVTKLSLGYRIDVARRGNLAANLGALCSAFSIPRALQEVYGGHPTAFMVFGGVRVR